MKLDKKKKKRAAYLFIIIAAALILSFAFFRFGSGAKNNKSAPVTQNYLKNTLIIGLPADAVNLIGNMAADAPTAEVASQIYDGLVRYDRNFKIVPDLAKSWKISNGGNNNK